MLFAFAPIKWITPINTTRIMASMIAYSPTPWPCSDRSLFKLKRPKLLASRKSVGSMFTFSLHRQEWPNSGNPKVTTAGLTTVIKTPIRLGRGLGSPTGRQGLEFWGTSAKQYSTQLPGPCTSHRDETDHFAGRDRKTANSTYCAVCLSSRSMFWAKSSQAKTKSTTKVFMRPSPAFCHGEYKAKPVRISCHAAQEA